MAGSSYYDRNEAAQERGYDSLYDQTNARREAREEIESMGVDFSRQDVWDMADFHRDFTEGDWSFDDLQDWFFDHFEDASMEDFYDFLDSLYDD